MPAYTPGASADRHGSLDTVAEFLDLAGHELRGPITTLKGQAQLFSRRLARQKDREADAVEVGKMLYQIERLDHELDVYLEAARLQRKRTHLRSESCDAVEIARKLIEVYGLGTTGSAMQLDIGRGAETLVGMWDKRKVRLTLGVLLSNAVKYGGGGDILVRVQRTGGMARIEVLDHGVGVPVNERSAIFKPYTTGSNAENSGVGLGLYVARELARRLRGRIGVRARAGGGSVFWLELPLSEPSSRQHDSAHPTTDQPQPTFINLKSRTTTDLHS